MTDSHSWADERYRVETPEQIELAYDVAGLGSRCLAALVDTAILLLAAGLVGFLGTLGLFGALGALAGLAGHRVGPGAFFWVLALMLLLAFAAIAGYYIVFEAAWHGQTPGKRWLGLRVVKEGGYPIGFVEAAIRNIVRLADFLPAYYMLGMVVMLIDGRARRLGDLAAGTFVVKERRGIALDTLLVPVTAVPADPAEPAIPNLHRLTAADLTLVREYIRRRESLSGAAAEALASRLATAFAAKLGADLGDEPADRFLTRLAGRTDAAVRRPSD